MEKLYYKDPYLREAESTVAKIEVSEENTKVTLNETLFYPESGGQPGDRGFINGIEVTDTKKSENGESILYLEKGAENKIRVKETVKQKLDWDHRYKFMKMHTAQHLLSGLLYTHFNIGTVAVHLGEEYLTIEIDREKIEQITIENLIRAANKELWAAHSVNYREMNHAEAENLGLRRPIKVNGDVRIVEIEGVDRIACGGVHVGKTSEIGLITAIGHEQIRGHVRIYFNCAEKALEEALKAEEQDGKLCALLSCKTEETAAKVASLLTENTRTKAQLASAETKLAEAEYREKEKDNTAIIETKLPVERFRGLGEKEENIELLAINREGEKCTWLIIQKGKETMDMKAFLSQSGARGGGRAPVYQGIVDKDKTENMKKIFREYTKNE